MSHSNKKTSGTFFVLYIFFYIFFLQLAILLSVFIVTENKNSDYILNVCNLVGEF